MLSIGLMSGTSMDGIDAALLETDGTADHLIEIGHTTIPYNAEFTIALKATEYVIRKFQGNVADARLHFEEGVREYLTDELKISQSTIAQPITLDSIITHLTQLHGNAVNKLLDEQGYAPEQIDVVGFHGQCMFHQPSKKISIIVGDGKALADQINITVVNDFRSRDIAAGGLGAPFAPLYHQALAVRDNTIPLAVVNCGGIANITLINGSTEKDLMAYDTGPGNGLIDRLVRQRTGGKENMDFNGTYGLKGKIHDTVLEALYQRAIIKEGQNYFLAQPPKSLDIGDMHLIPELATLSLEDACATLEAFTAKSIIRSLDLLETTVPNHWILAGGGWNNPVIYRELRLGLEQRIGEDLRLQTADEVGWNSQALEAQIFAFLAVRSLQNQPLSTYNTTRVPLSISGGQAHVPRRGATSKVKALIEQNPAILA